MNRMIRVGSNRMVALRYLMKNSAGHVLVDTMDDKPVTFLYGSGEIIDGLERELNGLQIGDRKSFVLSRQIAPDLDDAFYFDIIIDDIYWQGTGQDDDCGPDCACHHPQKEDL